MSQGRLNEEEFGDFYRFSLNPEAVLFLARACYINPDPQNLSLLHSADEPYLRRFLNQSFQALHRMAMRQNGNGILVSEDRAQELSGGWLNGFFRYQRDEEGKPQASVIELNRTKKQTLVHSPFPSVRILIKVMDAFLLNGHNREDPRFLKEMADAYKAFLEKDSSFSRECRLKGYGAFLSSYAREGELTSAYLWQNGRINWSNLETIFKLQADIALRRGVRNYPTIRREIEGIIRTYSPVMKPEFLYYRQQDSTVVSQKREEFGTTIRRNYLQTMGRLLKVESPSAFAAMPPETLMAMQRRGSFGQERDTDSIFAYTVEHIAPLKTADNFTDNFAVESLLVNFDMNRLVKLQTEALRARTDSLGVHESGYRTVREWGDQYPIVVMRPTHSFHNGLSGPLILPEKSSIAGTEKPEHIDAITERILKGAARPIHIQRMIDEGRAPRS